MPLPLILGIGAAILGAAGVGSGIRGGAKMKQANNTMEEAKSRHDKNIARFEAQNKKTSHVMDTLGEAELATLSNFEDFSCIIEKIHNKPKFKDIDMNGIKLPKYDAEEIKNASIGAGVLLGGIAGAAAGAAGGFAAAGATTAAVMAIGTASTGTAIATLSGIAATNATLAALGGGALIAGGGGMALGSAILGGATLGVGLLIGGIIFNITGSSLSQKADEAWNQMKKAENDINKICKFLVDLHDSAFKFRTSLYAANMVYNSHIKRLSTVVDDNGKVDWNSFTADEKLLTQNTIMIVTLLYNMCKVNLVLASENNTEVNKVNHEGIDKAISNTKDLLFTTK